MSAFYTKPADLVSGTTARANDINDRVDSVESGFDNAELVTTRSIKLPVGTTADQLISESAANRASKTIGFDTSGDLVLYSPYNWQGDWTTATAYVLHDTVKDSSTKNLYFCLVGHTAGTFATDLAASKWSLAINVADVETAKTAAQTAQTAAELAETNAETAQTAAELAETNAETAQTAAETAKGLAEDWAVKTSATVDGTNYSSKYWATSADVVAVAGKATQIGLLGTSDAISDMNTLGTADVVADLNTLGTADVVSDLNTLGTAGNVTNMNTLAGISANITTAAGISTDITTVAGKSTQLGLLGTTDAIADMNTLGTADVVADMNTLGTAATVTALNTLGTADVVADLNTLGTADVVTDMNTLGTADVVSDMNVLGTSSNVASMNVLGTSANVTNMATVATNIVDVNTFAEVYRISATAPTTALTEGDLYFDTALNAMKVYDGSAWINVAPVATSFTTSQISDLTATAAELNILDGVTSTAAELNILDGVTSTTAELNILDGVTSTAAELNILDGVTSTAAELNLLDGVTATTAELNYSDGVTSAIQTQLDAKETTAAITRTASINMADNVLQRPELKDYSETKVAMGANDVDLSAGNVFTKTISGSTTTLTFSNPPATGKGGAFTLILTNGGSQTVNFPNTVDWAAATAPTLTAAGVDVLTFTTVDGGTIWYGIASGLAMA